jgi:hypothetical protein
LFKKNDCLPKQKCHPVGLLRKKVREAKLKNLIDYLAYREGLPPMERRLWPDDPVAYYQVAAEDFFCRRPGEHNFHSHDELQQVLLNAEALSTGDYYELRKSDSKIPSNPHEFSWWRGWNDLFLHRLNPSLMRVGNLFYYKKEVALDKLIRAGVFCQSDYQVWRDALPKNEARFFPKSLFQAYGDWQWIVPGSGKVRFAAEQGRVARALGIKTRQAYLAAAAKNPQLHPRPEEFRDWPSRIERYSEKEAWEIFLGTFSDNYFDADAESRFYHKVMAHKEISAAEKFAKEFSPESLEKELEDGAEVFLPLAI